MTDILPVLLVVPAPLRDDYKLGLLMGTAETAYQVNGWDVKIDYQIVTLNQPDGRVYDRDYCIRTNLLDSDDLEAAARLALNSAKRKAYVIFVCSKIVEADDMITGWSRSAETNGESITGRAISFMALMEPKQTVGSGDGRTWAHEIGHGLGLRHVEVFNNFMSPSRHGDKGQLSGFDIAPQQLEVMRFYCKNLVENGI